VISREKMIALYSAMVKYRLLAAETQNRLTPPWQLTPGLEATVAGVTADLRRDDSFFSTESRLASALIPRANWPRANGKGLTGAALKAHAGKGRTSAATLEKQFASTVKSAEALKTAKRDGVALVFCETRFRADFWRRQLQSASRGNLPLVLVRLAQDSRRAHVTPAAFVFGVPRIAVDASDVRAVYRVASEAIARARHRRGPTLIECLQIAHPADDPSAGPIPAFEAVLRQKRLLNAALKQKVETAVRRQVNKALRQLGI